jgi:hypothetical protein
MNNRFGRDDRYRSPDDRYRSSDDRYRSPDEELETSQPYRQPREPYGQTYQRPEPRDAGAGRSPYGRSSFDYTFAPSPFGNSGWSDPGSERSRWGRESGGWSANTRGGYAGRGPKGYTRTDERIREDVCDRLSWDDEVDATEIIVRVQNGEVTLEGRVETRHMKRRAEDIAEDVSGVSDVHNTLRVTKPILTELKEKITGDAPTGHYANTGTKTSSTESGRNGTP